MGKRDAQQVTQARIALTDAREALEDHQLDSALQALDSALEALAEVDHSPGVSVAQAAERLGVSRKTVEAWIERGALHSVPGSRPTQVQVESLRRAARALDELRRRGHDGDWLRALADYLDDVHAQRRPALREGLDQVREGKLEPA